MKYFLIYTFFTLLVNLFTNSLFSQDEIKKKKLYISKINFGTSVPESIRNSLTNRIKLIIIQRFGNKYRVISDKDVALMNMKAAQLMKQGCDETTCMTQIADAIDADEIIYGDVFGDKDSIAISLTNINRDKQNFTLTSKSVVDLSFTEKQYEVYIKEITYKLIDPKYKMNLNVIDYTDLDKKTRWDLVWRSAVLPGWGQYYYNEKATGIIYGGLFTLGLIYNLSSFRPYQESKNKLFNDPLYYVTAFTPTTDYTVTFTNFFIYQSSFGENQKQYNKSYSNLTSSAGFVAAVYIFNLIDAFVFRSERSLLLVKSGVNSGWNLDLQFFPSATMNHQGDLRQYNISYTWRFE
jgi:hypothetical protein